jgi:hypothetical protein
MIYLSLVGVFLPNIFSSAVNSFSTGLGDFFPPNNDFGNDVAEEDDGEGEVLPLANRFSSTGDCRNNFLSSGEVWDLPLCGLLPNIWSISLFECCLENLGDSFSGGVLRNEDMESFLDWVDLSHLLASEARIVSPRSG